MMRRHRVVSIVWAFARWAWTNRKTAVFYELIVIREGREVQDYLNMIRRGANRLAARGLTTTLELTELSAEETPRATDIDQAWTDLQRREGEAGPA
jgi:hypothetical protein